MEGVRESRTLTPSKARAAQTDERRIILSTQKRTTDVKGTAGPGCITPTPTDHKRTVVFEVCSRRFFDCLSIGSVNGPFR